MYVHVLFELYFYTIFASITVPFIDSNTNDKSLKPNVEQGIYGQHDNIGMYLTIFL